MIAITFLWQLIVTATIAVIIISIWVNQPLVLENPWIIAAKMFQNIAEKYKLTLTDTPPTFAVDAFPVLVSLSGPPIQPPLDFKGYEPEKFYINIIVGITGLLLISIVGIIYSIDANKRLKKINLIFQAADPGSQIEKKFTAQNAQLEAIIEALPDLFFRVSSDGTIFEYRTKSSDDLYLTPEKFIGKRMQDVLPPMVGQQFEQAITQVQQKQALVRIEYSLLMTSGQQYYEARLVPLEKQEIIIIIRHISEQKKAEKALNESHALLELITKIQEKYIMAVAADDLFDQMLSNILDLTESEYGFIGEIFYRNNQEPDLEKTFLKMRSKANLKTTVLPEETQTLSANTSPEERQFYQLNPLFCTVILTGKPIISNNLSPAETPQGQVPPKFPSIQDFLGLPFYSNNKLIGLIGIANRTQGYNQDLINYLQPLLTTCANIIEAYRNEQRRQQAEEEILDLNQNLEQRVKERTEELEKLLETLSERTVQLEAINKELDSFCYSISHDLRAPLRHINGFVHALKRELTNYKIIEFTTINHYLEIIEESSQKMGDLIDGLLTLSRVGRKELILTTVCLRPLVDSAIHLVTFPKNTQKIKFIIGDLPSVKGDATLLKQVFVNLIDNAVKFSRDRSPAIIEINSFPDGTIFVKDNGVGFAREYADKLFGPFQRLHTQNKFKGTGIGLSIVQRIIHRHGGEIWAESELDKGATFYFKLA